MLIVTLVGFKASAASTISCTIDIDNPAAVECYQDYYNSSTGNYDHVDYPLTAGVNTINVVDAYGYGNANFYLRCKGDYVFTTLTENGSSVLYDNKSHSAYVYASSPSAFVVRTADLNDLRTASVTINIDDASLANVTRNGDSTPLVLQDGANTVKFNPSDELPLNISHIKGGYKDLGSVKLNGTSISRSEYSGYYVNAANGDVIDIVTYNPNATRYTLSFAEGTDLSAIKNVLINDTDRPISGWQSGISVEDGFTVRIEFDLDHYDITDLVDNGRTQGLYEDNLRIYMGENHVISYTATSKATVVTNKATFTLNGWDGNGIGIKKGSSSYDADVEFSASPITVEFTEDTQDYYIYSAGDYRIDEVRKNGTKQTVITKNDGTNYANVTVADGDAVTVQVSKFIDVYTATLTVTANLDDYIGDIMLTNQSGHVNTQIFSGANTIKFDATSTADRTFTLTSSTGDNLYIVKKGNTALSGSNGVYSLGALSDGAQVEVVAVDPSSVVKDPATIIFSDTNNNNAVDRVLIKNEDANWSDWQDYTYEDAIVGDHFVIYFKEGWEVSNLKFGNNGPYTYDPKIQAQQPLDYNGTIYYFNGDINEDYMAVTFTATQKTAPTISKLVTFNVNIPAGVKITDISDSQNKVVIPLSGTSSYHTFTAEYNYIDIESAEGYDLTSVTINPNDGNASYSPTPSDNKVGSVMVDNNYIVTVNVEAASGPSTPQYGTINVKVVGDPSKFTLMNGNTNATIPVVAGDNSIELYAELCSYMVVPGLAADIESVTLNGTGISVTNLFGNIFYALSSIKAGDEIVITTAGASGPVTPSSFTVNVTGDLEKISYLMDENRTQYTLAEGANTIDLPNNTGSFDFMLSCEQVLYNVSLNGTTLSPSYGSVYMFSVKGGDELNIETNFPNILAKVTWTFVGCTGDIVTSIRIAGEDMDDEDRDYYVEYGIDAMLGTNIEFSLDNTNYTISSVEYNGVRPKEYTNPNQSFNVLDDVEVTITAVQKRIYDFTLETNEPSRLLVYQGAYGNGQPVELTGTTTTLQINEVTGPEYITVGTKYGYYFDEDNCKIGRNRLTLSSEGYYIIYPQEDDEVTIEVIEVERPHTAAIYVNNYDSFDRVTLGSGRYDAFSSDEEGTEGGYYVFHFNDTDRGSDGFSLNVSIKEGESAPKVYVNNEQVAFNEDTNQILGLMLNDGDIVKVYNEEQTTNAVTFNHPNDDEVDLFTITIDRIIVHTPNKGAQGVRAAAPVASTSTQVLPGTEVTITASSTAKDPWVKVDGATTPIDAGKSYTLNTTGDHTISYGQNYVMTGIEDVMLDNTGTVVTDIYDLQGICIKHNADRNDIKALIPGVYVIGGHKIRIK